MHVHQWLVRCVVGCVVFGGAVAVVVAECKQTDIGDVRGSIKWQTSDDHDTTCHTWFIQTNPSSIITISVASLELVLSQNCEANYIDLGPIRLCTLQNKIPFAYIANGTTAIKVHYDSEVMSRQYFNLSYVITPAHGSHYCDKGDFVCENDNEKCILSSWRCNGAAECRDGSDEMHCSTTTIKTTLRHRTTEMYPPTTTPTTMITYPEVHTTIKPTATDHIKCGTIFNQTTGVITCQPSFGTYPGVCRYDIITHIKPLQLRFDRFVLRGSSFMRIYGGDPTESDAIGMYTAKDLPPRVIESQTNMTIYFQIANKTDVWQGFNATYQVKGYCINAYQFSCQKERDCYMHSRRCDGVWDCPLHGQDEMGCGGCGKQLFSCGPHSTSCYSELDRCNGQAHCKHQLTDELNCTDEQCGPHNGTYLCHQARCIPENWVCDGTKDCPFGDDEAHCPLSRKVAIAAIIGSLTCSLLLVIALGCTYKLHLLHTQHRSGRSHRRYISPVTQVQEEIMAQRSAPPPYLEAMRTSRSFEEVQREFIQRHATNRNGSSSGGDLGHGGNARTLHHGHSDTDQELSRDTDVLSSGEDEVVDDDDDVPLIDASTWVSDEALLDISIPTEQDQHTNSDPTSNVRISVTSGQETAQWCRHAPKPEPRSDTRSSTADILIQEPAGAASPSLTNKTSSTDEKHGHVQPVNDDVTSDGVSMCSADSVSPFDLSASRNERPDSWFDSDVNSVE